MMALAKASPNNLVQLGCIMAESSLAYSGRLSVSEQGVNSASLPLSSTIKRQVQFWQK